jgi:tripartite-type tricarboxylate transporter receptor subunit TctC
MRATAGAAAFGALAVLAVPAGAASVADFYRGKNLSLIIGFPPGGGYDAYARSVGAHIGRHLPGKPGVVVRNMPGASGLRAANFIYNAAPRDGTSFGIYSAGTVFAPLFGNKKAKYETAKFTWIGNVEKSVGSCATWHTSGFKSFNDLLNRAAIFGAGGVTGVQSEFPRSMNALIGT